MARVPAGPISYRRAPNEKTLRPGVLKPKTGGMKFTQPIMTKPKKPLVNTMGRTTMKRNPKNG